MKIGSIEKGLAIVEMLKDAPKGLSLTEISDQLGFPRSTCHHILSTYLSHDYVHQNAENKKYSLGYKFLEISRHILNGIDVRKMAHDDIRQLQRDCEEAVHLVILSKGQVVYIDKVDKPGGLSLATYIGYSVEPHATAGGKILLSKLSDNEIRQMYQNRPLKPFTKNTIVTIDKLIEEVEKVRIEGYALDNEELYEGIKCLAAPVLAGGSIVAALSVSGSIFTMTQKRLNSDIIGMVMKTAATISAKMRW